jgi:hypothetical protein
MAAVIGAAWLFIHLPRRSRTAEASPSGDGASAVEEALPSRLRLAPEWNCSPLWNADTGEPVSVYRLGLPFDLAARIEAWDDTFQATYNEADPAAGDFMDDAARKAYFVEGRAIVEALRAEWRGDLEVMESFR